jgi:hypothetical protein
MIDFELEDTDGHRRRLSEFRGRPVVLPVAGRESGEAAGRFGAALGPRLVDTDAVVVTIADTGGVPRLMRGMARGTIRAGLVRVQREAPGMPADAWDRFTLLLDWDGAALSALGLRGQTAHYHVLVLDRAGSEIGRIAQDDSPLDTQIETVLRWIRDA